MSTDLQNVTFSIQNRRLKLSVDQVEYLLNIPGQQFGVELTKNMCLIRYNVINIILMTLVTNLRAAFTLPALFSIAEHVTFGSTGVNFTTGNL